MYVEITYVLRGEIYCKNMRTVHVSSVCGHIMQRNYSNLNALRHEIH